MKICIAQTKPVKGDIERNIDDHIFFIQKAVEHSADLIVFPELSLTGYEPKLAKQLATDQNDIRFDEFQQISDASKITICSGVPIKTDQLPHIGMVIFQPNKQRTTYSKMHLHDDEKPFFSEGVSPVFIDYSNEKVTFAICYELSIAAHSENANINNASIYIASVAKDTAGVTKASQTLTSIAEKYLMTVLMSNCVGTYDNIKCKGESAAWDSKGQLIEQLNQTGKGILILDTNSKDIIKETFL